MARQEQSLRRLFLIAADLLPFPADVLPLIVSPSSCDTITLIQLSKDKGIMYFRTRSVKETRE